MGWAHGAEIMVTIIRAVQPHVPDQAVREAIYAPIVKVLEDGDWDTQDAATGIDLAFDLLMERIHPGRFDRT